MRIFHYDMVLSEPYHFDCNPDIHNYNGIRDAEAVKWPGMRMIVEECGDIEKFYASFEYRRVDNAHPKFERQMLTVLRGGLPEWKLESVDIDNHELHLGFMNETLFDKYASKCRAIEAWNRAHPHFRRYAPPPFYAESAISYKPDIGAKIRFELDNPVSGNTEVTIVSFFQDWNNSVTEFDGNKVRTFTFQHEESLNQYPISVKEWMIQ